MNCYYLIALGLRALLDYSYTGTICISDANLQVTIYNISGQCKTIDKKYE